jgi:hypothetical protein
MAGQQEDRVPGEQQAEQVEQAQRGDRAPVAG